MASAHGATSLFIRLAPPMLAYPSATISTATHRFRPRAILASSISTPSLRKLARRKNYLRTKILKTLTKPFPTAPLPEIDPVEPIVPTQENDVVFDSFSEEISSDIFTAEETDKVEEFPATVEAISNPGDYGGNVIQISSKFVSKFPRYLVGFFVFPTICAVWILKNTNSPEKDGNSHCLDKKGGVLVNGNEKLGSRLSNVGDYGESELEERINEIRLMAREVREKERRERKEGDDDSGIEKEIGARLVKLEKRLNSQREKLPVSFMDYLGNPEDDIDEDSLDSKEENDNLMFRKKLKFRSHSLNPKSTPTGFSGSRSGSKTDQNGELRQGVTKKGRESASLELNSLTQNGNVLEKDRKKLQKEMRPGAVQESKDGRSTIKDVKSRNSRNVETPNSQSLTDENQEITRKADASASSIRNGSRKPGKRPLSKNAGHKRLDEQADMWWSNLPYVLAILMRRGSKHEAQGLFALREPSQVNDQDDSSYTIAFEDRGDANNFCYLLESFFEDLGDFAADIVPLPTKELLQAVTSHSKKVIVVKKGQLKLYVGQPFAEVEMALLSLL
uniref:Wound-responsive family protein n=1 Tax=Rhizophora mucronata TaxID=61149 RepID=A0A2P2IZZ5_RHIMU